MKSKLIAITALVLVAFTACNKEKADNDGTTTGTDSFTAKVDNVNFTSKEHAAVSNSCSGSFLITAEDNQDNSIMISGPTQTGTFSSSSNSKTSGTYFNSDGAYWMSTLGGNATVTITKFDAASKKMSGTFSFSAPASGASGATGTKTVTSGSFNDVSFVTP